MRLWNEATDYSGYDGDEDKGEPEPMLGPIFFFGKDKDDD